MSLVKRLIDLDRKFAWSFVGVVIAVLFGAITIYREFILDQRPALRYDILTSTSVLDVKEEVSNLNVLFDGMDIRKQGLSLRVITVRILNDSSKDILKGFYDDRAPLGLSVSTGKIIKSELAGASNDYLSENALLTARDETALLFPSLIIEAGQSFTVKLLVLHPSNEVPALKALGKIAGVPSIPIREAYKDVGKEHFLAASFRGGFLVQLIRFLAYTLGTLLLLVCVIVPITVVSDKLDERARRKSVEEFKASTKLDLNESDQFILTEYVKMGAIFLLAMRSFMDEPNRLAGLHAHPHGRLNTEREAAEGDYFLREQYRALGVLVEPPRTDEYLKAGVVKKTDKGLLPDAHAEETLDHLTRFLRAKGLLPGKTDFLITPRDALPGRPKAEEAPDQPNDERSVAEDSE